SELAIPAGLEAQMRNETRALIDNVIFDEQRPWKDLLTSSQTFINDTLAEHYGISGPGTGDEFGWVEYSDGMRRGLLAHGSFLGAGLAAEDTSPTLRGQMVR